MKKLLFKIVFISLFVTTLALQFYVSPITALPKTWTVDDNGPADFTTITGALLAANPGDTIYVHNGIYYENLYITKSNLTVIGESQSGAIIDGVGDTVIQIFEDNVVISGFTIRNGGWEDVYPHGNGVHTRFQTSSCKIEKNIISNCRIGIFLYTANSNNIVDNTLFNVDMGIAFGGPVYYNIVRNNSISQCRIAVFFQDNASYNTVAKNQILESEKGVYFNYPYHNIVAENDIKCILLGDAKYGVQLQMEGYNNTVDNNKIADCDYGIASRVSDNNTLRNNRLSNCTYGIEAREQSNGNKIIRNDLVNNTLAITLWDSNNNTVSLNNLIGNANGIQLWSPSESNTIERNLVINSSSALNLNYAVNNVLVENTLSDNYVGLSQYEAYNNIIYHNNFINNTFHTSLYNSINMWNDSYPSGGNYWSDYAGPDSYSGLYQNETGSDGLGDEAYIIDENNQDNYPLIKPCTNIAVIEITTSKTTVGQGYSLSINIELENQGYFTETSNLTIHINAVTIQIDGVILTRRNSTTIVYSWSTVGCEKGTYFISSILSLVEGEKYTADNTFVDGTVYVGIPGDVASSFGQVDMKDIGTVVKTFGSVPGHPKWNPNTDINCDGKVDMKDVGITVQHFGQTG